jgi:hypothetical protein
MNETHCTDVPMITALQSFERMENRCENPNAAQHSSPTKSGAQKSRGSTRPNEILY